MARERRSEEISSRSLGSLVILEKCGRINSKQTVMRDNILTPQAQGNLLRDHQNRKNMEHTNHQYMSKIFQFLQKKLEMSATNATFSMEAYNTKCVDMVNVHDIVDKAAIPLGPNYVSNSEIFKNTKSSTIDSVFNITQKLVMEQSDEILDVKCLEY